VGVVVTAGGAVVLSEGATLVRLAVGRDAVRVSDGRLGDRVGWGRLLPPPQPATSSAVSRAPSAREACRRRSVMADRLLEDVAGLAGY
jgi:hypothetical protein